MIGIFTVSAETKLYATIGLVVLALYEFWSAMYVYGRKEPGKKHVRLVTSSHRLLGYIFLVYWLWPVFAGLGLISQLSEVAGAAWRVEPGDGRPLYMDARVFYHALLGTVVLLLLLLKIAFVRIWTNYRKHARMLGIIIFLAAVVTWIISGLYWMMMFGSPVIEK
jgi:hypothetical protein